MQHIGATTAAIGKAKPSASSASTGSLTNGSATVRRQDPELQAAPSAPPPPSHLRRIWGRMAAIYPNRGRSAMGEAPQTPDGKLTIYGDTWGKGLAGLTDAQLAAGLEACITRADAWPPTLAEFRALCLGIPALADVREDMRRTDADRQPFTVMVGRRLDSYRYRLASMDQADRLLREAYDSAVAARMRGEELPEVLLQVAADDAPAPVPATRDSALAHIEEGLRILRGGGAE